MNRDEIMQVVESIVLSLDDVSKKRMLGYGLREKEIEMGIKFYVYLKNKELMLEVIDGN